MEENKALILVADDCEVNRQVVRLMLQKAGYIVDAVDNGQQAVEACRHKQYDLILMDIQMPILDGYDATRKIRELELEAQDSKREREPKAESPKLKGKNCEGLSAFSFQPSARAKRIPIIAMSGNAGEASFDEKQYPGMDDCIGKPMQFDRLLAVVQKWLSTKPAPRISEYPAGASDPIAMGSEENQFPLDLDRAIQEFMGKKEILLGVLQKFIISAAARIHNIRQAVKTTDYDIIGMEAHGLRGGAANLTADRLANLAADLERAGKEQQPDLTAELAEKLAQEFGNLERYVQQNQELMTTNQ